MHARIAKPSDEEAVSALLRAAYATLMANDYAPAVLAEALPIMTRANPGLLASGTFYVVDGPDGLVVGCGGWTLGAPGSGTEIGGLAHLRHFGTHPDFARRGIGRLIYERCAAAARAAGAEYFQAYSSLTAVPFYASVGLRFVRDFELLLGGKVKMPAVVMEGRI